MNSKSSCCCLTGSARVTSLGHRAVVLGAVTVGTGLIAASTFFTVSTAAAGADPDPSSAGSDRNQPPVWRNTPTGKPHLSKTVSAPGSGPEGVPPNNDCANAVAIFDGNTPYDNIGATTDGPSHGSCLFFGDSQVGADIWFDYTATQSGTLIVSLCGSSYDTKMALYQGAACPIDDSNLLACNDDFCGLQSFFTIPVIQGTQYKLRVGGFTDGGGNSAQGDGNISLTYAQPLTNDACVDRIVVTDGVTLFDTTGATTDGIPHAACDAFGDADVGSDVWFNYTATQTGFLRIELCGSAYDTKLAAYNTCVCPATEDNLIACNDDTCGLQSRVQFDVTQGQCIKIRVGGFLGATGQGQMTISYVTNPCPNPKHTCDVEGGPGCSDADCCNTICAIDPFCCEVAWDGICVDEFFTFCFDCVVTCPPDGVQEVEPCGADMNGGCNTPTLDCQTIQCNDTVCGTQWSSPELRDTDWYCFTITQPGTVVTWSVTSEFAPLAIIASQQCTLIADSTGNCPNVAQTVLGPGTYFAVVAPSAFVDLPCGGPDNDYIGTLEAQCAPPCEGDIDGDGDVDMDDLLLLIRNWGDCDG
jgi:hypothetical protein